MSRELITLVIKAITLITVSSLVLFVHANVEVEITFHPLKVRIKKKVVR